MHEIPVEEDLKVILPQILGEILCRRRDSSLQPSDSLLLIWLMSYIWDLADFCLARGLILVASTLVDL